MSNTVQAVEDEWKGDGGLNANLGYSRKSSSRSDYRGSIKVVSKSRKGEV
jgi:hypothetical protein